MKFSKALKKLRKGESVSRKGWQNGTYLKIGNEEQTELSKPLIYQSCIHYGSSRDLITHWKWLPNQEDILSNDWFIFPVHVKIGISSSQADEYSQEVLSKMKIRMQKALKEAYDNGDIRNY